MKQYVYLLILPIMFLISCSDDTVEEMGGSNHVLLERYPQEVINISMDNPESFASFNKTSVTRSSELLKDSVWSSGNGHTLIYETNEHIPIAVIFIIFVFNSSFKSLNNVKFNE